MQTKIICFLLQDMEIVRVIYFFIFSWKEAALELYAFNFINFYLRFSWSLLDFANGFIFCFANELRE